MHQEANPISLQPLLNAAQPVPLHALAALGALVLSGHQLLAPKGTNAHRVTGALWVVLMLTVAISSFWIHTIRQFGDFSWIHLLSVLTLVAVPYGVWSAHRHNVSAHRATHAVSRGSRSSPAASCITWCSAPKWPPRNTE